MFFENQAKITPVFCLFCVLGCASTPAPLPSTGPEAAAEPEAADGEKPLQSGDGGADSEKTGAAPDESEAQEPELKSPPSVSLASGASPDQTQEALPVGTKVLHVGDSFAGALGLPLGKLLEDAEVSSVLKHTDSSYLTDWAWNGKLQKYIWRYNPDLIIITLGGNELEIANPERREKTVKKIISTLEGRPCVWVGVPLWKGPQNGLMEVIREHSSPCIYMDTERLIDLNEMARLRDGVHPTKEARRLWAEAAFAWLREHRKDDGERPWSMKP